MNRANRAGEGGHEKQQTRPVTRVQDPITESDFAELINLILDPTSLPATSGGRGILRSALGDGASHGKG